MVQVGVKRLVDVLLSLIALMTLFPLFLVVAFAIKLDSKGPMFYRAERIGRGGKPFKPYKFRTMVTGAQKISDVVSTPNDDPRITRVGKILRRYNLDELAQFINVLTGEMSVVGPRPEVPRYIELLTDEEKVILSVRPGITDLATVWIGDKGEILAGHEDPEKVYLEKIRPGKIRLQLEYVRNRSLWIDFEIMWNTVGVHLFDRFRS